MQQWHFVLCQPLCFPCWRRYGAHTDYQGFTVLLQDDRDEGKLDSGGLEVWIGDAWVPVTPRQGCFVVNVGDLYSLWTNGRWKSTIHRVTNPQRGSIAAQRSRFSAPFFSGPRGASVITALPTRKCVDDSHPPQHDAVTASAHLHAKLGVSNV